MGKPIKGMCGLTAGQLEYVKKFIRPQIEAEIISNVNIVTISAMLLALNSVLGIGPGRGAKVVDEINRLMEELPPEEIVQKAKEKMM